MTRLEHITTELNFINWTIGQASTEEDRQLLEDRYKTKIQQILNEIELLKQNNNK
jgi:hypothetical protein